MFGFVAYFHWGIARVILSWRLRNDITWKLKHNVVSTTLRHFALALGNCQRKIEQLELCEASCIVFLCLQAGGDYVTKDSVIQCWNSQTKMSRINLFGFHSEIFIFLVFFFYGLVRNIFEGFSRFLLLSSHMGNRGNKIELKVVFVNDKLNIYTWRWKVFVRWNFVTKQWHLHIRL